MFVASEQRPGGSHGLGTEPPRPRVQLPQRMLDGCRKPVVHEAARRLPVLELRVHPQVREHLEKVRLAASEEAAHPDGILARAVEVAEVAFQDPLERVGELALADEGFQLGAQLPHHPLVPALSDSGLAVVREAHAQRVAVEQVHGSSSCRTLG